MVLASPKRSRCRASSDRAPVPPDPSALFHWQAAVREDCAHPSARFTPQSCSRPYVLGRRPADCCRHARLTSPLSPLHYHPGRLRSDHSEQASAALEVCPHDFHSAVCVFPLGWDHKGRLSGGLSHIPAR